MGGGDTVFGGQPGKRSLLGSHGAHLRSTPRAAGPRSAQAPPGLEGVADAVDSAVARGPKQGSQHRGECVKMFVRVDVADGETARLNALYLGDGLGLNLLLADAAAQQITQEATHRIAERKGLRTARVEQRGNFTGAQAR